MFPETGVLEIGVLKVGATADLACVDMAAAEEPLELRLGGRPFVVIMRTPGDDRELAAGFLVSERIVAERGDTASMRYCTDERGADASNVLSAKRTAGIRASSAASRGATRRIASGCSRRSCATRSPTRGDVGRGDRPRRGRAHALPDTVRS